MMRRTALCLAVLTAVLAATGVSPAGEVAPEDMERLKEELRRRRPDLAPAAPTTHKAPEARADAEPAPPAPLAAERSAFEEYVAGRGVPGELRQFGYELFQDRGRRFPPVTAVAVGPEYVLGPGDEVAVRIWGKVELEAAATVDRAGKLALPRVGAFPVAGRTLGELRKEVRERYDRVYTDYQLDVGLGGLKSLGVTVVGRVRQPGRYELGSLSTVLNALMAAGGPDKSGTLRAVELRRDGKLAATLDVYELLTSGTAGGDVRLLPEDTVFVPPGGARAALAGAVRCPAIFELKPGEMNLSRLVALAGGLEPTADRGRFQVERIGPAGKLEVAEAQLAAALDPEKGKGFPLRDGDVVRVFGVLRRRTNVVHLAGNVARPGEYELRKGMRVSDLVRDLESLVPEAAWRAGAAPRPEGGPGDPEAAPGEPGPSRAFPQPYWDYALVRRLVRPELRTEFIPFDLGAALLRRDRAADLELQPDDTVIVFSKWDFAHRPLVSVGGAVNRAGAYPVTEGMRLRDLVSLAGGLRSFAHRGQAELLRVYFEPGGQREERLLVDLGSALAGAAGDNLPLQERDHLFVRSVPEHREPAAVTLAGEVRFPGSYPVRRGEKLSSVIERAGGYTDRAYLRGAEFTRESVRRLQQERLEEMIARLEVELARLTAAEAQTAASKEAAESAAAQAAWQTQLLGRLRAAKAQGRVVIALEAAGRGAGPAADIAIESGDRLFVPERPDTISVLGTVHNQTAFLWKEKAAYDHYLKLAGGPTRFADRRGIYVIHCDGSVSSLAQGRSGLRWDAGRARWTTGGLPGAELFPGDTVIVPEELERVPWMRNAKDITQILYQIAVATGVLVLAF